MDLVIHVIEKRLNSMGITDPHITRDGGDGFQVRVAGIESKQTTRIRNTLERVSRIELRGVSPRNDERGDNGRTLAEKVHDGSEIVPGYRVYMLRVRDEEGKDDFRPILLHRRVAISGADIANVVPSPHQPDAVAITLNREGTDKMITLTKDLRPGRDRIAIVLDGKVISAPFVNQVPIGKHFIIEGLEEPGEALRLANTLMNPLENPIIIEKFEIIPPPGK